MKSYQLQANCYLSKPVQLDAFESLVKSINDFWLAKAKLPPSRVDAPGALDEADPGPAELKEIMRSGRRGILSSSLGRRQSRRCPADAGSLPRSVNPSIPARRDDGVEAMAFLRTRGAPFDAPRPDLILLDLNLPRWMAARSWPTSRRIAPENHPDRHPDHLRGGSGHRQELSAPGELLPQQARATRRVREPGEEHQRFLADQGQAAAARANRVSEGGNRALADRGNHESHWSKRYAHTSSAGRRQPR